MAYVLVDPDKVKRATRIADLVRGEASPLSEEESKAIVRYVAIAKDKGVDISKKVEKADVVRFCYEALLGGLVRTEAEQEKVDVVKREYKKKVGKK